MIRKLKQRTDRVMVIELSGNVSDREFEAVFDDHAEETPKPWETTGASARGIVIIANKDFEGFSSSSVFSTGEAP